MLLLCGFYSSCLMVSVLGLYCSVVTVFLIFLIFSGQVLSEAIVAHIPDIPIHHSQSCLIWHCASCLQSKHSPAKNSFKWQMPYKSDRSDTLLSRKYTVWGVFLLLNVIVLHLAKKCQTFMKVIYLFLISATVDSVRSQTNAIEAVFI